MTTFIYDVFALMANLAQEHDSERLVAIYVQTLNRGQPHFSLAYQTEAPSPEVDSLEICTAHRTFGYFCLTGNPDAVSPECPRILQHSVQILAGYLEALHEQSRLQAQVDETTARLKKNKDLLNVTHRLSKIGGWEWDVAQQTMYWTHETYRIHGVEPEADIPDSTELIDRSLECYDPEDRPLVLAAFRKCAETGASYDLRCPFTPLHGQRRWIRTTATAIMDQEKIVKVIGCIMDITDSNHTEEALRESQALFQSLVESMPQSVFSKDLAGRFTFANQHYCATEGKPLDMIVGKTDYDLHPPDLAEKYRMDDLHVLETGQVFETVEAHQPIGEEKFYVHVIKTPIYDASNNISGVMGMFWDITERKRTQEALRASEARLRLVLQNMPVMMDAFDEQGHIIVWNQECERVTGYSASEIIGNPQAAFLLYPDEDYRTYLMEQLASHGNAFRNLEWDIACKGGGKKTILWSNISGQFPVPGWYSWAIGSDITDRKQAEEALRASEQKLSTLFGAMTEMIVLHDVVYDEHGEAVNYRITDCNHAFTTLMSIPRQDAVGKFATEVYQTEPAPYLDIYAKVAQTGEPYGFTIYYPPLDKHLLVSAVSPRKGQFATITTDITAIKQAEEALAAKNKELENYLYVASHDLRSPLVNIQGFSQRLQRQTTGIEHILSQCALPPDRYQRLEIIIQTEIPRSLEFIFTNVAKIDTLIKGILQISRTGRVTMNIQKIDMNALIQTILHALNFQIEAASANITVTELPECYGDAQLLNQLFSNLIDNALKYRDKERLLTITISARIHYQKVIYKIEDTGMGLAPRHLDKIWNVFYQVDSRAEEAGEGIGLSLVKRIVDKHRGRVWVRSELGQGAAFYVELQRQGFAE